MTSTTKALSSLSPIIERSLQELIVALAQKENWTEQKRWRLLEGILTLNELSKLIDTLSKQSFFKKNASSSVAQFLENRWNRIKFTPACYTQYWENPITHLCVSLAKHLGEKSKPINENYLIYLMPSVQKASLDDTYASFKEGAILPRLNAQRNEIRNRAPKLEHYILVIYANQEILLNIPDAIEFARVDGIPKYVSSDGSFQFYLTHQHQQLMSLQLPEVSDWLQLVKANTGIYNQLRLLRESLHQGAVGNQGSENFAGMSAYTGLINFRQYVESLSQDEINTLNSFPEFLNIMRPISSQVRVGDVSTCVNIAQASLEEFLIRHEDRLRHINDHSQPDIRILKTFPEHEDNYFRKHENARLNGFNIYGQPGIQRLSNIILDRIFSDMFWNNGQSKHPLVAMTLLAIKPLDQYDAILAATDPHRTLLSLLPKFNNQENKPLNAEQIDAILNLSRECPPYIDNYQMVRDIVRIFSEEQIEKLFVSWNISSLISNFHELINFIAQTFVTPQMLRRINSRRFLNSSEQRKEFLFQLTRFYQGNKPKDIFENILTTAVRNVDFTISTSQFCQMSKSLSHANFLVLCQHLHDTGALEQIIGSIYEISELTDMHMDERILLVNFMPQEWWDRHSWEIQILFRMIDRHADFLDRIDKINIARGFASLLQSQEGLIELASANKFLFENSPNRNKTNFFSWVVRLLFEHKLDTIFKNHLAAEPKIIAQLYLALQASAANTQNVTLNQTYTHQKQGVIIKDGFELLHSILMDCFITSDWKMLAQALLGFEHNHQRIELLSLFLEQGILDPQAKQLAVVLGKTTLFLPRETVSEYVSLLFDTFQPKQEDEADTFTRGFLASTDCSHWDIVFQKLNRLSANQFTEHSYARLSLNTAITPREERPTLNSIIDMIDCYDQSVGIFRKASRFLFSQSSPEHAGRTRLMGELAKYMNEEQAINSSMTTPLTDEQIEKIKQLICERYLRWEDTAWLVNVLMARSISKQASATTRATMRVFGTN